jgi:hypothetical protein
MSRITVFLLTLAAAAALGGCRRADCVSTCEARQKVLECGSASCKDLCEKLHSSPVCGRELQTFEACVLKQPVEKWECDGAHEPTVKPDVCAPESAAVMKCLRETPPPATPPAK